MANTHLFLSLEGGLEKQFGAPGLESDCRPLPYKGSALPLSYKGNVVPIDTIWTVDLRITSALLYQLSYTGIRSFIKDPTIKDHLFLPLVGELTGGQGGTRTHTPFGTSS